MTVYLSDNFVASSGGLNNRVPTLNLNSTGSWINGDAQLAQDEFGRVVCTYGIDPTGLGAAQCPVSTPSWSYSASGLNTGDVSMVLRREATDWASWFAGVQLGVGRENESGYSSRSYAYITASAGPVWTLVLGDDAQGNFGTWPIAFDAATDYTLKLAFSDTALTATFGGQTYTANTPVFNGAGLRATALVMVVGRTIQVDSVEMTDGAAVVPPPESGMGGSTITCPRPSALAFGGAKVSLAASMPILQATAHDSTGELSATLTAPSPTLRAYAGASSGLTAPTQSLTTTGTVTGWATAALSVPAPTIVTTGTTSGMATAALKAPSPNLVGYSGAVCSITLTGSPTLQASATVGGIGGAALSCPLFELTSSATAQNHGSANLLAPSPRMGQTAQAWLAAPGARLSAIGSAVITATYEAYAVNLKHTARPGVEPVDEATRYTNFPFTHVIRHKGSYYGANSTGLYLLEGTTDDATPIPWAVKTAMTDFKSPTLKTVASAYFSGRFGPASNITLSAGEKAPVAYSFTTPRGALAQNHRQAFGRGLKARYYALAASGTGTCEIDAIELDVHNLTRRI